jgi:hypothetical protein
VADEDDPFQFLHLEQFDDVLNVERQIDAGMREMDSIAQTRERGRKDGMPGFAKETCDSRPAPPAMPRPVDENEGCRGPLH